jgi:hypothetical protein
MFIRLSNLDLVEDLCAAFLRSGFDAESVGGGLVEVGRRNTPAASERLEVELQLRVWRAMNPGAVADLLA